MASPRRSLALRRLLLALSVAASEAAASGAAASEDAQTCLLTGHGCGEAEVEMAEDAALELLRVELLQQGLSRQRISAATGGAASSLASGDAKSAGTADGRGAATSEGVGAAAAPVAAASPAAATAAASAPAKAAGAAPPEAESTSKAASASGSAAAAAAANQVSSSAGQEHAHDVQSHRSGSDVHALLVDKADVEVTKAAEEILEQQFPGIFRDALKELGGNAVDSAKNASALVLDTAFNSTLAVVQSAVATLPAKCVELREAMLAKMKGSSAGGQRERMRALEDTIDEAVDKFEASWQPVIFALQALHAAVPAALRTSGLSSTADLAEATLGGSESAPDDDGAAPSFSASDIGLLRRARSVEASVKKISRSLQGSAEDAPDVATEKLDKLQSQTKSFLAKVDGLGESLSEGIANLTKTASEQLGVSPVLFSASQQTASSAIDSMEDAAQELGSGITEASELTGVSRHRTAAPAEPEPAKEELRGVLGRRILWASAAFAAAAILLWVLRHNMRAPPGGCSN